MKKTINIFINLLVFTGLIILLENCGNSEQKANPESLSKKDSVEVTIKETKKEIKAKPIGPISITLIESRTKKTPRYTLRMYSYFVKNFYDDKKTNEKMIETAKKLPFDNDGLTEVFFFNDKEKSPKMDPNFGWGRNESQNSWNTKYGKYCVGYFTIGLDDDGTFSKGWD
ncbi:MAG TPA: hypothetical protein PLC59_11215 [Bacteroidales bacterium]|nr:hypothetical protein [Bacteroidales bacterium]